MPQLFLDDCAEKSTAWTTGASRIELLDSSPANCFYPMSIMCQLGSLEEDYTALLDTGSYHTLIPGEIAELIEGDFGQKLSIDEIRIHSRLGGGTKQGHMYELPIRLPSLPEFGCDLEVRAKVLVLEDWSHIVLGVNGFLEALRFGIDPARDSMIYFGLLNG